MISTLQIILSDAWKNCKAHLDAIPLPTGPSFLAHIPLPSATNAYLLWTDNLQICLSRDLTSLISWKWNSWVCRGQSPQNWWRMIQEQGRTKAKYAHHASWPQRAVRLVWDLYLEHSHTFPAGQRTITQMPSIIQNWSNYSLEASLQFQTSQPWEIWSIWEMGRSFRTIQLNPESKLPQTLLLCRNSSFGLRSVSLGVPYLAPFAAVRRAEKALRRPSSGIRPSSAILLVCHTNSGTVWSRTSVISCHSCTYWPLWAVQDPPFSLVARSWEGMMLQCTGPGCFVWLSRQKVRKSTSSGFESRRQLRIGWRYRRQCGCASLPPLTMPLLKLAVLNLIARS